MFYIAGLILGGFDHRIVDSRRFEALLRAVSACFDHLRPTTSPSQYRVQTEGLHVSKQVIKICLEVERLDVAPMK